MLSDEHIPFLSFLYEVLSTPTKTISIETDNEMTKGNEKKVRRSSEVKGTSATETSNDAFFLLL